MAGVRGSLAFQPAKKDARIAGAMRASGRKEYEPDPDKQSDYFWGAGTGVGAGVVAVVAAASAWAFSTIS